MHAPEAAQTETLPLLVAELSRLRGESVWGLATSADMAVDSEVIHQLVPVDSSGSVARFLDHWRPDAGIILGPPDRPQLLTEARKRGTRLILAGAVRGQLAPYGRVGHLPASLMGLFDRYLLTSAAEAQAFHRLELQAELIHVTGPLSDTALPQPGDNGEIDRLSRILGGRPVWLAANVTTDEIGAIEAAQRRTIRAAHRLLLVIVPRERSDGITIADALEAQGWRTALRSAGGEPDETVQVLVADASDEMGLWLRLAPVTFIGGTLDAAAPPLDPYEAAALGSAIVHGPHFSERAARFGRLEKAGASLRIESSADLGPAIQSLLSPDKVASMAHAGWLVTSESAHVLERVVDMVDAMLDGPEA